MAEKSTPHIVLEGQEIAETILLPGDPLRAKLIADTFLDNSVQFNHVRNMFGYTGEYKGKKISVMGTGMGMPSMGLYSYELIHTFGVKNLIRIGSCGALQAEIPLHDLVIAMAAATNSSYADQYELPGQLPATASYDLLEKAVNTAKATGQAYHVGNILTSDIFYHPSKTFNQKWQEMGVLAIDMETAALYWNAIAANVNALSIMTVSDNIITGEALSAKDRQTAFSNMMETALEMTL